MTTKITRKYLLKHFIGDTTEFWVYLINGMYSFDDMNYNSFHFIVVLYKKDLLLSNKVINRKTLYDAIEVKINEMLSIIETNPKQFYDECNKSVQTYTSLKTKYNIK